MKFFSRNMVAGMLAMVLSQVFFSCTSNHLQSDRNNFPANNELSIAQFSQHQQNMIAEANNASSLEIVENENTTALASAEKLPVIVKQRKFPQVESNFKSHSKKLLRKENISRKQLKFKPLSVTGKNAAKDEPKGKNQWIALALAFFLGAYGVHRFYLGHTQSAVFQLTLIILALLAFVAAFIFIPLEAPILFVALYVLGFVLVIINSVWVLIDLVNILTGNLKPKDGEYGETIDF